MQEILKWEEMLKKLNDNKQILAKIGVLDSLDQYFGLEEHYTLKVCKEIYDDYCGIIKNKDNDLEKIRKIVFLEFSNLDYVYSVTTRIKDVFSLIQKVILRRYKYYKDSIVGPKYRGISKETYKLVISDLIGVRVTLRNTSEFLRFDEDLKRFYKLQSGCRPGVLLPHQNESIIAEYPTFKHPRYESDKIKKYADVFNLEPQDSGYRSVHYILSRNGFYVELQVRTIFDDGWSECNHEFVYKKDDHVYSMAISELSDVLRLLSSSSNEICEIMKSIYNEYLESKIDNTIHGYKFCKSEDEKIKDVIKIINKASNSLELFNKKIVKE